MTVCVVSHAIANSVSKLELSYVLFSLSKYDRIAVKSTADHTN
jgi:hypothetical protein